MNINTITAEDLRRMPDKEGLILQGCGGDLTEWVDGINEMLTKAGILKDGCQFENVAAFQHGELHLHGDASHYPSQKDPSDRQRCR